MLQGYYRIQKGCNRRNSYETWSTHEVRTRLRTAFRGKTLIVKSFYNWSFVRNKYILTGSTEGRGFAWDFVTTVMNILYSVRTEHLLTGWMARGTLYVMEFSQSASKSIIMWNCKHSSTGTNAPWMELSSHATNIFSWFFQHGNPSISVTIYSRPWCIILHLQSTLKTGSSIKLLYTATSSCLS